MKELLKKQGKLKRELEHLKTLKFDPKLNRQEENLVFSEELKVRRKYDFIKKLVKSMEVQNENK